jgi:SAM-dependent methyltransferase
VSEPEFDAYAADYGAGMDNPVKALLGTSADDFVAIKLRWLLRRFPFLRHQGRFFRILDYGCGTATLLRLMTAQGLAATLLGCDISSGMLHQAAESWPAGMRVPQLYPQDGVRVPLPDASVDLVIISAVLHHVPPEDRNVVYAELWRVLCSEGHLVVFEHNPWNPVTRYVVAHTPIDQNAILLRASEVSAALHQMPFDDVRTDYLMFLPPRLQRFAILENCVRWLPLGAQYATTARRR